MKILNELEPIKVKLHELSLGEIMRGTRDLLGLKQWKIASLLGLNVAQMKILESNTYRADPDPQIIREFCELFGYDFHKVWDQAVSHVYRHKKTMEMFGKHPHYAKRLDQMKRAVPAHPMQSVQLRGEQGAKCNFTYQASR